MVTFPDEFIGGLFQGTLNADVATPSHDLTEVFSGELNNLNDETVLLSQNVTQGYCLLRMFP